MTTNSTGENIRVSQKPISPPPGTLPKYSPFLKNTGPEYIGCYLNSLVYVWTIYRNSFWIYPVDSIESILFCYAWDGSDWKYIQFNVNLIDCLC